MADVITGATPTGATPAAPADTEAEELLRHLNELLEQLERVPGPAGRLAMDTVTALSELYGAALARVMALVDGEPRIPGALGEDELLRHLLVLHGIHPLPVADRVAGALDRLRPHVRLAGGALVLDSIDGGVARIVIPAGRPGGCGPEPTALREEIVSCVLSVAPELSDVEVRQERGGSSPTLIAAESLLRRPGGKPGREAAGGKPGGQGCELCGRPAGDAHRHLLDTSRDELLCACQACTVLFGRDQASDGRFRLVPDRRLWVPGLAPAALGVPVGLAFFVRHADGSVSAHYPSPAGATRWTVDPRAWATATSGRPELATLAADVEALLVNTVRGHSDAWLVPIDDCRRLVATVRRHWKGLSGGDLVWPEIERFFDDLNELSEPRRRDGLRPGG